MNPSNRINISSEGHQRESKFDSSMAFLQGVGVQTVEEILKNATLPPPSLQWG